MSPRGLRSGTSRPSSTSRYGEKPTLKSSSAARTPVGNLGTPSSTAFLAYFAAPAFLIPPKNPEVLAEKIIYLLKSKDLQKKMGNVGRKVIEAKNDYYKEMGKMEKIYRELIIRN